jgi:hypothetical protein
MKSGVILAVNSGTTHSRSECQLRARALPTVVEQLEESLRSHRKCVAKGGRFARLAAELIPKSEAKLNRYRAELKSLSVEKARALDISTLSGNGQAEATRVVVA